MASFWKARRKTWAEAWGLGSSGRAARSLCQSMVGSRWTKMGAKQHIYKRKVSVVCDCLGVLTSPLHDRQSITCMLRYINLSKQSGPQGDELTYSIGGEQLQCGCSISLGQMNPHIAGPFYHHGRAWRTRVFKWPARVHGELLNREEDQPEAMENDG